MNIEPTDDELKELLACFGAPQSEFEQRREQLVRMWEAAAMESLHAGLWPTLKRRVHEMMSPPPSVTRRDNWI